MTITATEFKENLENTNPNASAVDFIRGILKDVPDIDLDTEREERLSKHEICG